MPPVELIEKRTRSSKTHSLGGRKYALDCSIGAIHYKNNPRDGAEHWKDIDTTISIDGRVSAAPYDLDVYLTGMPGFHYKSKESGEFDIRLKTARMENLVDVPPKIPMPKIEGNKVIWENIYPDTDVILEVESTRVSLKRILKSDKAPLEYDVDIDEVKGVAELVPLRPALDANKQALLMDEKVITGGRTEKLKLEPIELETAQPIAFPIEDATIIEEQVATGTDDGHERGDGGMRLSESYIPYGDQATSVYGASRHVVTIPNGMVIDTAYLIMVALVDDSGNFNSDFYAEDGADPGTFTTATGNMSGRTPTTLSVPFDNPESWITLGTYNSPELKSFIQELYDSYDYSSGAAMVIISHIDSGFGERLAKSFENSQVNAIKLHIEYSEVGAPEEEGGAQYTRVSIMGILVLRG